MTFATDGYHLARRLLLPVEVNHYRTALREAAADPAEAHFRHGIGFARPDGITLRQEFWPLISHPRLLAEARALLGPDIMYVRHSDLHVNHPLYPAWHRDIHLHTNVIFKKASGSRHPHTIVRALFYLNETDFLVMPGSHTRKGDFRANSANLVNRAIRKHGHVVSVGRHKRLHLTPGDCLFINVLLVHSGTLCNPEVNEKLGLFLSYGQPNHHSFEHSKRYTDRTNEAEVDPELKSILVRHGIYSPDFPI